MGTVVAAAFERVAKLDFTMLKHKLGQEKGWSPEHQSEVEDLYRRFLALISFTRTGRSAQLAQLTNSGTLIFLIPERMRQTVITYSANTFITSRTLVCVVPMTLPNYRLHLIRARNCLFVILESIHLEARRKLAVAHLSVVPNCHVRSCFDPVFATARERCCS